MKILMINANFREIRELRHILGDGHEVWAANNERSAKSLFQTFKPHAAVLFLNDLNPSNEKLVQVFQGKNGSLHCHVVGLAPFSNFRLIQQVLDWGVDAYLSLPCDMQRVKRLLEKNLSHLIGEENEEKQIAGNKS